MFHVVIIIIVIASAAGAGAAALVGRRLPSPQLCSFVKGCRFAPRTFFLFPAVRSPGATYLLSGSAEAFKLQRCAVVQKLRPFGSHGRSDLRGSSANNSRNFLLSFCGYVLGGSSPFDGEILSVSLCCGQYGYNHVMNQTSITNFQQSWRGSQSSEMFVKTYLSLY